MARPKKQKQQTLEETLGRSPVRTTIRSPRLRKGKAVQGTPVASSPARNAPPVSNSPPAPPSSFMRSSQVLGSSRKRGVAFRESSPEDTSEDEQERALSVRETRRGRGRQLSKSESESESELSIGPSEKGKKAQEDSDDQADDDDKPLATPIARRRRHLVASESEEDEEPPDSPPIKRRRLIRRNAASSPTREDKENKDEEERPAPSSARTSRARRKPLTQKEKARELRRRKRAGEVINNEDYDSLFTDEEEPRGGLYDSDPSLVALDEFEDDEEGVNEPKLTATEKKKSKKKRNRVVVDEDEDEDDDSEGMDDFVVEDGDAPLGAPDDEDHNIPLELTAYARSPLKVHFRVAIEWLVKFKVNPEFSEREAEVYRMAWKKLDDEVSGLATSKFASAAWKKDFYMALRARPYINNVGLSGSAVLESQHCGACGRSGHPAKYSMTFTGDPYYKNTARLDRFLKPVEADSESDSDSEPHDDDEDGNAIPKPEKEWYVGAVCNGNAETAHALIHWKSNLLVFVDTRLHVEGRMAPAKVIEREHMEAEQMDELVDKIMNRWEDSGLVKSLYSDFKVTIEKARNKPTSRNYR